VLNWRIFVAAKSRDKALRLFRRIEEARGDGFRTTHHLRYFKDPSLWEAAANEPCRERTPGARLLFAFARAQMLGRGWHVGHVDIATGECDLTFDARHGSVSAFGSLVWVNVHLWPPGAKELGDDLPRTWLAVPSRPSGS
jgi:hypothetical protein